jgi:hypothetical protein
LLAIAACCCLFGACVAFAIHFKQKGTSDS